MKSKIFELFEDSKLVEKIKNRLPYLFQLAEMESSRGGKIGMEVGSIREKIIIALLIYKFGEESIRTDIPITKSEIDVIFYKQPISIKTISGKNLTNFKLLWTVDAQKAREFLDTYKPISDILLIHINWDNKGGFYYIPLTTQIHILNKLGKTNYIKLPKGGTNPRGVEITKKALIELVSSDFTKKIEINWKRVNIENNPFKKWIDLWSID